jgi:hypothetical protein
MLAYLLNKDIKFSRVPQAEDYEALATPPRTKLSRCFIPLLCITSFAVGALLGALLGSRWFSNSNLFCTAYLSQYCRRLVKDPSLQWLTCLPAPVMKDVDMSYKLVRFNGSLLKENVFRQDAGPEVDAAWLSLGVDCECLHISYDDC